MTARLNRVSAAKITTVLLLALVAVHPLLQVALPWSDDGLLHFWRVVELDHCLRSGYLYPRWMPDMAYGYGYPLLNYYAPLSVYLAEGFHLLGFDFTAALLAALAASLILGALGAYLWARDIFGLAGGLVAAVAYAYAPYFLYDIIWRGNLAESLALGLLPWVFWRFRRLARSGSGANLALAALALAALVLTHNITALIAAPLLAVYAFLLWLAADRSRRMLIPLVGALILGLILSAFFWLPAFMERGLVQTEKMVTTSHFDYRHNFLTAGELVSPPVPADVTLMNPPVPRSLGWAALALAALGALRNWVLARSKNREAQASLPVAHPVSLRGETLFMLAGLLLCAFLTLPASRALWETIPLLSFVGFPWRFLGVAGLAAAWLAGASVRRMHTWRPAVQACAAGLAVLAITTFSLPWLYPRYLLPITSTTPADLIAFELASGAVGTTSVGEYLPVAVQELPDPAALEAQYRSGGAIRRLPPNSLPPGASILSETWHLTGGDITISSAADWTATLNLFFFPGWRVEIDDHPVKVTASTPHGLVQFAVPAGEARIRLRFGLTPWRLAGSLLSAAGLVALAVLAVRLSQPAPGTPERPAEQSSGVWIGVLAAVGLVFTAKTLYLDTHDSPLRYAGFDGHQVRGVSTPMQVNFDDGLRLLGRDPAELQAASGSILPVTLYWAADAPPGQEYSSFLHLVDAAGHHWGQSDNQHPGGFPTLRWRPGEYNRDAHTLAVAPGTPPGTYTLRAGLIGRTTGTGLDVLDERGAPAGTSVVVGVVTVTRPDQPPPLESLPITRRLDAHLDPLTLFSASLDRAQAAPGETLLLTLYWQAARTPEQDYAIMVELVDSEDVAAARFSRPPAAAAYPTNLWTAGEIVQGQHWLVLPAELNSGDYALRLQLLGSNNKPIGEPLMLGESARMAVIAPDRQTAIPPMAHRLDANLADRATLLGYDLAPGAPRPGGTLRLTLYWRAGQPMRRSYAVFAHLLDAQNRIAAQHDGLPAGWTRPTTGWLPGEVIADVHELALDANLPPGVYTLEVGLYNPETKVRLPVLDEAGQIIKDRVLLEPVSVER